MKAGGTWVEEDRLAADGRAGRALSGFLVLDAHAHISTTSGFPYVDSSVESTVRVMDRLGIARTYVSSTTAIYGLARQGNDEVIEAMRRYPGRIRGYMVVNVGYEDTILPEMERCYAAGIRAVKIWSYGNRPGLPYDHRNYEVVFGFAEERGLPVLAHTWGLPVDREYWGGELEQLEPAFRKYRRITWILAHSGSRQVEQYIRVACDYEHVYLETSFSVCPRGLIERFVGSVPLEKIVWGSDRIYMNTAHQLGRVLFAGISEGEKWAILGENAARALESGLAA
jgi:hypothetical protein